MRPHPKFSETDPDAPRAWGTCQQCGFIWNLHMLGWNREWRGTSIESTGILVCPRCQDKPNRQLGTFILPPDPVGIPNARPEQYLQEELPVSVHTNTNNQIHVWAGTQSPYLTQQIAAISGSMNNDPNSI